MRVESGVDPVALRDGRLRMDLTQHELARLIDVAGSERISRWELGQLPSRQIASSRTLWMLDCGPAGAPEESHSGSDEGESEVLTAPDSCT